jgi:hypothetical protein
MDIQEIEVFIDKDGQTRLQVRGVKGDACLEITRPLEEALGGQVYEREMTNEASQGSQVLRDERLHNRGSGG